MEQRGVGGEFQRTKVNSLYYTDYTMNVSMKCTNIALNYILYYIKPNTID